MEGKRGNDLQALTEIADNDVLIVDTGEGTRKITYGALCAAVKNTLGIREVVESTNITEPGFLMDGKTASEALAELYSKFQKNSVEKSIIIPSGTKITDVVLNEISERSSWGFAFIGVSTGGGIPLDFDYATGFVVHTGNTGSVILFSRRHSDMAINSYTGTNWTGWREL